MRALIFGGGGQIGRAVALTLRQAGWQVDAVTRSPHLLAAGVTPLPPARRAAHMARGYDAVIDTLAFTAADAADLLAEPAAHLTVISTASVYADAQGRGLETPDLGFPHYPDPIPEDQLLVSPAAAILRAKSLRKPRCTATPPFCAPGPCMASAHAILVSGGSSSGHWMGGSGFPWQMRGGRFSTPPRPQELPA